MKRECQGAGVAVHEESEKLFEAMALGELDEFGRARLCALASTDPSLAARLKEELEIEAMLAALGPNHAPKGLAAKVFERLDSAPALASTDISQAVQRTFAGRRTGFPWIPIAYLRWASAMAILGIVVFEVGLLVVQHRQNELEPDQTLAMALGRSVHTTPAAQLSFEDVASDGDQASARVATVRDNMSLTPAGEAPMAMAPALAERQVSMASENPSPATEPPMQGTAGSPAFKAKGVERPIGQDSTEILDEVVRGGDLDTTFRGDAYAFQAVQPTPVPSAPASAALEAENATEAGASEEKVAPDRMLAVVATTASQPMIESKSPADVEPRRVRVLERQVALRMPLSMVIGVKVIRSADNNLEGLVYGLTGAKAPETVKQSLAGDRIIQTPADVDSGKAVSLRDVEMAIAVAGGDIVSRERIAGDREAWKITTRMTPAALRKFLEKYSSPLAAEEDSEASQAGLTREEPVVDRHFAYRVVEGRNLLWALGFEAAALSTDTKTTGGLEPFVPLTQRPTPRPDQKIDVILLLGDASASPSVRP